MKINYNLAKYMNSSNMAMVRRLCEREHKNNRELASNICSATCVPIFLSYRLIGFFKELSQEDIENITELENFYGALVSLENFVDSQ